MWPTFEVISRHNSPKGHLLKVLLPRTFWLKNNLPLSFSLSLHTANPHPGKSEDSFPFWTQGKVSLAKKRAPHRTALPTYLVTYISEAKDTLSKLKLMVGLSDQWLAEMILVAFSTLTILIYDTGEFRVSFKLIKAKSCIPESPIWCPKMVELRCVMLREYPPNGLRGSSVKVIVTEMLMGPESSRVCGDCVEDLACPLVTVLSGVVVSLMRCFRVSFSDIQKSKSLNLRRKVFQSLKQM